MPGSSKRSAKGRTKWKNSSRSIPASEDTSEDKSNSEPRCGPQTRHSPRQNARKLPVSALMKGREGNNKRKDKAKRQKISAFDLPENTREGQLKKASGDAFYSKIEKDTVKYFPAQARLKYPLKDNIGDIVRLQKSVDNDNWGSFPKLKTFKNKWMVENGKFFNTQTNAKFPKPREVTSYEDIFETICKVDKHNNFSQSHSALSVEVSKISHNISMKLVKLYMNVCQLRESKHRSSNLKAKRKTVDRQMVNCKREEFVDTLKGCTVATKFENLEDESRANVGKGDVGSKQVAGPGVDVENGDVDSLTDHILGPTADVEKDNVNFQTDQVSGSTADVGKDDVESKQVLGPGADVGKDDVGSKQVAGPRVDVENGDVDSPTDHISGPTVDVEKDNVNSQTDQVSGPTADIEKGDVRGN